ncbi:MAG: bifunctional phosphopantothenoylcysteine decarboxylase/phosphopantothenate--cysteine ligase CoaBC [Niastella sp.]|nr:bifunctional phosphopantothenoylcysteine decarboxylase/phosphopantothenate--cysteine ligase CoaBC [Niastella sp.]
MLTNKKILIGVSGSIAAYKIAVLVRLLVKEGAIVKVIMTPASTAFVTPLTLSTLSKNEVLHSLATDSSWANHVLLGRWADVMLIAPLSCNTLAKMAHGLCDNLLTAVYLSATCKVLVAPAMDEDMWHHATTKENIEKIKSFGNLVLPVHHGELASGLRGEGRMAEPEEMITYLQNYFQQHTTLAGKQIVITAGPTYEPIDPVRFIGNHSSGKMGIALAEECKNRGATVLLIHGPIKQQIPVGMHSISVQTAQQMYDACMKVFENTDIFIMAAAVADYAVAEISETKIKKKEDELILTLHKTPDILKQLGAIKKKEQLLVGFALETDHEKENAIKKLKLKNADYMILNSMRDKGAGFGYDSNKITIFDKAENCFEFALKSKKEVAADIVNTITQKGHV